MCDEDFERDHISLWKYGRGKAHNAQTQQHNCVIKLIDRGVAVVSVASFLSVRELRICSSAQRAVRELSASPPVVLSLPSGVLLRYVSERKTVEPL